MKVWIFKIRDHRWQYNDPWPLTRLSSLESDMSLLFQGLIVSLLSAGCLAGALMGGFLSDLVGRKPVVILGASLVSLGALLHTAALNLW